MPRCSKSTNPKGIEIVFTEDDHRYSSIINGKEVVYMSGTTFVNHFTQPFDPDGKIIERCAKKNGLTVQQMREVWDKKKNNSCDFGTKIHTICESVIKGNPYELLNDDAHGRRVSVVAETIAKKIKNGINVIGAERIVFDPFLPYPIAGTIDLLGTSKKDGSTLILDWKTNEKIELENIYDKFMKPPIEDVPDISYYHYALQLSLYQKILISGGYVPKETKFKRAIIHLTDTGYKIHMLPDYTEKIEKMLHTF